MRDSSYANTLFEQLLKEASQPKSVSGQSCVRLCGLADQASKSSSEELRRWAFSEDITSKLFNFYIEWNESDNHRSMKLVLDVVAQSILKNSSREDASRIKKGILETLVSIVTGHSTKPVAKSAIKTLDHLLSKGVIPLRDIYSTYIHIRVEVGDNEPVEIWRRFTSELFHWMKLHFVCPTAGRLIVTIYRHWRQEGQPENSVPSIAVWHQWLLVFLAEEPTLLESIKNYIFLPLFKADRSEALKFLGRMSQHQEVSGSANMDMDIPALLQLAALETGKRVGLVEEPGERTMTARLSCSSFVRGQHANNLCRSFFFLTQLLAKMKVMQVILLHPLPCMRMCSRAFCRIPLMTCDLWHYHFS